jgi:predicted nucleotidyltransferase
MTDTSEELRDMQAEEIESLREENKTIHVTDIDPSTREKIRTSITELVKNVVEENITVTEIFVYGSFATGEAIPDVSDLDVRIIVQHSNEITMKDKIQYEQKLMKHSTNMSNEFPFAFIDPKLIKKDADAANGETTL